MSQYIHCQFILNRKSTKFNIILKSEYTLFHRSNLEDDPISITKIILLF